jgi:hypothetical protein
MHLAGNMHLISLTIAIIAVTPAALSRPVPSNSLTTRDTDNGVFERAPATLAQPPGQPPGGNFIVLPSREALYRWVVGDRTLRISTQPSVQKHDGTSARLQREEQTGTVTDRLDLRKLKATLLLRVWETPTSRNVEFPFQIQIRTINDDGSHTLKQFHGSHFRDGSDGTFKFRIYDIPIVDHEPAPT